MQDASRITTRLEAYTFDLPSRQIALEPVRPRSASRLLVVDRRTGQCQDSHFHLLDSYLRPGDLLVLNNTRVLKARVSGRLLRNGREVELLFAAPRQDSNTWAALLRPGRRIRQGDRIAVADGSELTVGESGDGAMRAITLTRGVHTSILDLLEAQGSIPLPPYIHRPSTARDETDYQTSFASQPGAIAAPTAGLHFTPEVFQSLDSKGIRTTEITLHVGAGTFTPIRSDDARDHVLPGERYTLSQPAADSLNQAHGEGRRIIAVGTTTTRTLESVFSRHGRFVAGQGEADLYILPGYDFRVVDGLLTNFHLPRSTLLLLVCAFASRKLALEVYRRAVASGYRFYSYGDCSLFL